MAEAVIAGAQGKTSTDGASDSKGTLSGAGAEKASEGKKADEGKKDGNADETQAGEAATGDGKQQDGKGSKDAPAKEPAKTGEVKPPETYTLAVPETATDFLGDEDVKAIEAIAKKGGWSNAQAQEALQELGDSLEQTNERYRLETVADETYGGDHLGETQRHATRVLDRFAPKDDPLGQQLRRDLVKTGYGNKLSVVSLLARIGKAMAEDGPTGGLSGAQGGSRAPEDVLYDKTAKT